MLVGNFAGGSFAGFDRAYCDIGNEVSVRKTIKTVQCDIVINAAAYTAVDNAESNAARALVINGTAPGWIAEESVNSGKALIHISTDFVFGEGHSVPITIDAATCPLNIYGETKLAGEEAVKAVMRDALIVRTRWVYAATGQNFLNTMLRLMNEREELGIISDQIGTPTAVRDLALAIIALAEVGAHGTYHYTNTGVASWYDFAVAISEEAYAIGLLSSKIDINPIPASAYPTPAVRHHYSVMDKERTWQVLGKTAPHWREALRKTLLEIEPHT